MLAKVSVGYRPRLGISGPRQRRRRRVRNRGDGTHGTDRRHDAKGRGEIEKLNHDGSLPPGVKVVPFYDRSSLIAVTTHTVLHNLIFGCLLVFLIQWIFLGNLRSAVIVGLNIPFALFFATILLVIMGESANLLSAGRGGFRHHRGFGGHPGREHLPQFSTQHAEERQGLLQRLTGGFWGPDPTQAPDHAHASPRMDGPFAADSDQRDTGGQGGSLLSADHRGRLCAALHDAGSRGPDLRPHGADLWLRAGRRADCHLHHHAGDRFVAAA